MEIKEIKVTKFPLVITTDVHGSIGRMSSLKRRHPDAEFICLGDITDLFRVVEDLNKNCLDYFITNKIPCLEGNHESFIKACYDKDYATLSNVLINMSPSSLKSFQYNLDEQGKHGGLLRSLPRGFKLILPDGNHYLCFHNRPNDLWSVNTINDVPKLEDTYPVEENTIGVIHGHMHVPFVKDYPNGKKRYSIGAVKYDDYALLTEKGVIEFKRI